MASPARPEQKQTSPIQQAEESVSPCREPVYLRHRHHGELGQLLRDYYADVVDQPLPDRLLRLVEQFRQREQNK